VVHHVIMGERSQVHGFIGRREPGIRPHILFSQDPGRQQAKCRAQQFPFRDIFPCRIRRVMYQAKGISP